MERIKTQKMKIYCSLAIIFGFIFTLNYIYAASTFTSVQSGNWDDASTWGAISLAAFSNAYGVALDSDGNIYEADFTTSHVGKLNSSGVLVNSFIGNPNSPFSSPRSVVIDSSGNIYVADTGNSRIVKLDSDGTVLDNFTGDPESQFNQPFAVTLDSSGNIFVSDTVNNRVVELDSSGAVLNTFTGDPESPFSTPNGIAVDSSGNIYVADSDNSRIVKMDSTGAVLNNFTDESIVNPYGVALDTSGNIYVAKNGGIIKLDSTGAVLDIFDGGESPASFNSVAVDSSGNIYGAEYNAGQIIKMDSTGTVIATFDGSDTVDPEGIEFPGADDDAIISYDNTITLTQDQSVHDLLYKTGEFSTQGTVDLSGNTLNITGATRKIFTSVQSGPWNERSTWGISTTSILSLYGLTVDASGNIFLADRTNHQVVKLSASGEVLDSFVGDPESPVGELLSVTVDENGNIYIPEFGPRIIKVDSSGNVLDTFIGDPESQFAASGVAVDSSGNMYVADIFGARIVKLDSSDNVLGSFASSSLGTPFGPVFDSQGNLYVSSQDNNTVVKFDTDGNILDIFSGDPESPLSAPTGLALDAEDNIYVADQFNNRIVKLDSSGNNIANFSANFNTPTWVSVDTSGNIYVADSGNARVVKLDPSGNVLAIFNGVTNEEGIDFPSSTDNAVISAGTVVGLTQDQTINDITYEVGEDEDDGVVDLNGHTLTVGPIIEVPETEPTPETLVIVHHTPSGKRKSASQIPFAPGIVFNPLLPSGISPLNPSSLTPSFTRDLKTGANDPEVKSLQIYLNTHGFTVSTTGPGSLGSETNYFGSKTRAALILFQKAHNITPSVGYFGPKTRRAVMTEN